MRKIVLMLSLTAAAIFLQASTASANSFVNYTITGTYTPTTQTTSVSAPNQTFQLKFTINLPVGTINSDPSSYTTLTPTVFTLGTTTLSDSSSVQVFFTQLSGGGANIQFNTPGNIMATWSFISQPL